MVDLTPFQDGIRAAFSNIPETCADPRGEFINLLISEGFTPPRSLAINKFDNIAGENKKKKSGWYIYNEIDDFQNSNYVIGVATYGDFKTDYKNSWSSRKSGAMNERERVAFNIAREQMRVEREREQVEKHKEVAAEAFKIWSSSPQASDDHGYLKSKGVKAAVGVKVDASGNLIIPAAISNQISTLQFIKPSGEFEIRGEKIGNKKFLSGGKTKGAWFLIEGNSDVIYICEGYATGASVHEATGSMVYVSFNAGNIYETASHVKATYEGARIIIAGDDDTSSPGNAGRTKAEQASNGLGIECVFPAGFTDFNDQHQAHGIKSLRDYLTGQSAASYKAPEKAVNKAPKPSGILSDIIDYYHATSGIRQEGFAVQTALAIASIVLGRSYKTNFDNFPSLFLLNVGKSGTGKEHAKNLVEKVMHEAGLSHYIAGDGYTSAGAVFTTLLDRPKHISVIDEFGRYLEAGRDLGKGNNNQREANTKLMESIGRGHSVMRPASYSAMTSKKSEADAIKNRMVYNPAITLLTMTTPSTLFKTLDMGAIKDGFINRFILSISDVERDIRRHMPAIDVPERIISWINATISRNDQANAALEPASPVELEFTTEAMDAQTEFQYYCVDKANALERFGMSELSGRSNEMAMKISLIHALSRDPYATKIDLEDMNFGIAYIKSCLEKTIDNLKVSISHSDFEADKKEILSDIRGREADGITWSSMQKTPPYSKFKGKDLKDIMNALKDADLVSDEPYQPPGGGRPTVKWIALK